MDDTKFVSQAGELENAIIELTKILNRTFNNDPRHDEETCREVLAWYDEREAKILEIASIYQNKS